MPSLVKCISYARLSFTTNSFKQSPSAWCWLSIVCYSLGFCLVLACYVLDNHLTSITKQCLSSKCQLAKHFSTAWNCLTMACQMLCADWQVIVKHLESRYQAQAKRVAHNWRKWKAASSRRQWLNRVVGVQGYANLAKGLQWIQILCGVTFMQISL